MILINNLAEYLQELDFKDAKKEDLDKAIQLVQKKLTLYFSKGNIKSSSPIQSIMTKLTSLKKGSIIRIREAISTLLKTSKTI